MPERYRDLLAQSRGRSLANEAAGQDWNDAGRGVGPPPPPPPQSVDFSDAPQEVQGRPPPPDERPLDLNIPKTTQASASNPLTQLGKAVTAAKPEDSTPHQPPPPPPHTPRPPAPNTGPIHPA